MNVIGALKKSCCLSTIFFCEYSSRDFDLEQLADVFQCCNSENLIKEDDVLCVAVESENNSLNDSKIVGLSYKNESCCINIAIPEYEELTEYLEAVTAE